MVNERIKSARLAAGLTQTELGRRVNKSVSTVSEWELGKRTPDLEILPDLARALNVSVAYLIGDTSSPTPTATWTETEAEIYAYSMRPNVFRFLLGCALLVETTDDDANVVISGPGILVDETPELVNNVMEQTISFFMYILHLKSRGKEEPQDDL
jgi:transcriptional regulator with XRE-family HTH domain